MKQKISELAAFLIFVIGIGFMVCLIAARMNEYIRPWPFVLGMAVTGVTLWQDADWIDRHFVDGEWI